MSSDDEFGLDMSVLIREDDRPAQQQKKASPLKPSYRGSAAHQETLKLLTGLTPGFVNIPTRAELREALVSVLDETGYDVELDEVKRELAERLDADLSDLTEAIEQEFHAVRKGRKWFVNEFAPGASEELSMHNDSDAADDLAGHANDDDDIPLHKKRKRQRGLAVTNSSLPVVLGKTVGKRPCIMLQLDDPRQDLTGDSGAVGRVHVQKGGGIAIDLKGHEYAAQLMRAPSLLVVSMGNEEGKIEDVVETVCILRHHRDHIKELGGTVLNGNQEDDSVYRRDNEDNVDILSEGGLSSEEEHNSARKKPRPKGAGMTKAKVKRPRVKKGSSAARGSTQRGGKHAAK